MSKIVRDLYSIKPISTSRRWTLTERVARDLSDWRVELSRFLDADTLNTSLAPPIFQRQRNVLSLTYWHAIILTYRPLVLSSFARMSRKGVKEAREDVQTEESVRQCLMAAMNTVNRIDEITQTRQMFRAFWVGTLVKAWLRGMEKLTGAPRLRRTLPLRQPLSCTST